MQYMLHLCQWHRRKNRSFCIGSREGGITGSWEPNTGPLQEQEMLTTEPSRWSQHSVMKSSALQAR